MPWQTNSTFFIAIPRFRAWIIPYKTTDCNQRLLNYIGKRYAIHIEAKKQLLRSGASRRRMGRVHIHLIFLYDRSIIL